MEKKCSFVQDILPTYIEKMTSEETNQFVEEHLKTCMECQKVHQAMLEDIEKATIKNTEVVKTIQKYKRKIFRIKLLIFIILLAIFIYLGGYFGFRYWVVSKAFKRNTNYDVNGNFTIAEYEESIERYENHVTTYYQDNKMKKVYGDKLLEYYDGKDHYYFNDDEKTYYVQKDVVNSDKLTIDFDISGMEDIIQGEKINQLAILKYVIFSDNVFIQKEGFRNKEYYVIKNIEGQRVFLDKDTFFVERVERSSKDKKEYRITTASVGWREVQMPDLSRYTLIEK